MSTEQTTAQRKEIEGQIITRVIADALKDKTIELSVDDHQARTRDAAALLAAATACDEARLFFHRKGVARAYGWVFFVLGNSGWDVICDYTTNLDPAVAPANALADRLEALAYLG